MRTDLPALSKHFGYFSLPGLIAQWLERRLRANMNHKPSELGLIAENPFPQGYVGHSAGVTTFLLLVKYLVNMRVQSSY